MAAKTGKPTPSLSLSELHVALGELDARLIFFLGTAVRFFLGPLDLVFSWSSGQCGWVSI